MAAADLTVLKKRMMDILKMTSTYASTGDIDQEYRFDGAIADALLQADARIAAMICNNPYHARRKDFMSFSQLSIATGSQINTHIGPLESVQFVITGGSMAGTWPGVDVAALYGFDKGLSEIRHCLMNPLALDVMETYYLIDGDTIYHVGPGIVIGGASTVAVNLTGCAFALTAALQCPEEYSDGILAAALQMQFPKAGHLLGAGQYFGQIADAIMQGMASIPNFEASMTGRQQNA